MVNSCPAFLFLPMKNFTIRTWHNIIAQMIGASCFILLFCGCNPRSTEPLLGFISTEQFKDGTENITVTSYWNNDSIMFGETRIRESILKYVGRNGDSLGLRLWYPPAGNYDSTQLIVLIPGYGASSLTLFPMAVACTRRNIITGIVSLRGFGQNSRHNPTFGLQEHQDVVDAISAFQKRSNISEVRVAIFGVSLGGVVAINAAVEDARIKGIVLEGIPFDLQKTADRVLSGRELSIARYALEGREAVVDSLSPKSSISRLRPTVPLMAQWGSQDDVVTADEQISLRQEFKKINPSVILRTIDSAGHTMRLGFPLSQQQAIRINEEIAEMLERVLQK